MRNVSNPNMSVSFFAERSIQDEIERESKSDAFTILISYMFMFGYIAFALGQYQVTGNNLCSLLINSKAMLGVAGVLIVALSVTSSIGVYAFYGIPATMIILEVQPFLVLAVGVDNIFIFVQAYQVNSARLPLCHVPPPVHHPTTPDRCFIFSVSESILGKISKRASDASAAKSSRACC